MTKQQALQACARWLSACISMGWSKDQLDALEKIWWRWHDETGRLLKEPRDDNGE